MLEDCQSCRPHTVDGKTVDTKRAMPKVVRSTILVINKVGAISTALWILSLHCHSFSRSDIFIFLLWFIV